MKHITKLFLVGFLATGLVGCFGDSDGDKTPDNPINLPSGSTIGSTATYSNSVTYSGKTNIASFSATDGVNAFYTSIFDDMADDLFEGVDFLFDLEGEYDTYSTRMLSDVRNIRKSSIFQPYIEKSNRYASKSTSQTSNTISSECSNGSLTVSTTDDWSLNYYKMEFVANDFCVNSAVGEIRMNGSSVYEEGEDFYLTEFNNFSLKIGANFDILIGGISISEVIGEDLTRSTVNMVFKNQKSGLQVKFENYVNIMDETYYWDYYYDYFTEEGRIYHSDHGYVDISTLDRLKVDYSVIEHDYPVAGKIKINASNAYIMTFGESQYTIGLDSTGNNQADTDIQSYNY